MLKEEERIQSREDLREWLGYELGRYGRTNIIARILHVGEKSILCQHQILLRKTEYYVNTYKKIRAIIFRTRLRKLQNKYSLNIPLNCCGRGFKLMHIGPVLINGKSTIGRDCVLHINTAIVANGKEEEAPIINDGVVLCVGACVVGNIFIASNVVIGANAVVIKDVLDPNIAVGGIPAKKISDNGRLTWKCQT